MGGTNTVEINFFLSTQIESPAQMQPPPYRYVQEPYPTSKVHLRVDCCVCLKTNPHWFTEDSCGKWGKIKTPRKWVYLHSSCLKVFVSSNLFFRSFLTIHLSIHPLIDKSIDWFIHSFIWPAGHTEARFLEFSEVVCRTFRHSNVNLEIFWGQQLCIRVNSFRVVFYPILSLLWMKCQYAVLISV